VTGRTVFAALALAAACAAPGDAADDGTRALERHLQDEVDRWARVRQPTASSMHIALVDRPRPVGPTALDPLARRVGRLAYASGAVLPGDTVTVEFQRLRRLGPFELGRAATRFVYTAPPASAGDVGAFLPGASNP
jgi:hypothetical protein